MTRPARAPHGWTPSTALGDLSPKQRACIVLVDYADLDAASTSAILGMAEATVRVHLLRGRRALRARLDLPEEGSQ